jgi:hypothetical protein
MQRTVFENYTPAVRHDSRAPVSRNFFEDLLQLLTAGHGPKLSFQRSTSMFAVGAAPQRLLSAIVSFAARQPNGEVATITAPFLFFGKRD